MPHLESTVSTEIDSLSTCPSCSKEVTGNYCQHCGERTLNNKPDLRFSHFLNEAYYELFDLDSKFLRTLKYLILRPGFLTVEWMKGKRNAYIKPFRLYVTMVVLHFFVFKAIPSGDIFNMDRFPAMQYSIGLPQAVKENQARDKRPEAEFKADLNERFKNNLSIVLYMVVFLEAIVLQVLYWSLNRYYVEHLHFVFHLFSFAFVRNVMLIPFFMLDLLPAAAVVAIISQVAYTFLALKKVYSQNNLITTIKFFAFIASIIALFYFAIHVCVLTALAQIG